MENGLVSVVIPVYNGAKYIRECLLSVFNQTYTNIEVIVIDDGSSDDLEGQIREFKKRIRFFRRPHEGLSKTRNFGLKMAKGKYVAFLDVDDLWKPEKLSAQVNLMEKNPGIGMVYCAVDLIDERGQPIDGMQKSFQKASGWIFKNLLECNFICISTVVIKKEVVDNVGFFNEKFKIANDYDYWLRLSLLTQVDCLSEPLALYRLSIYAMSAKKDRVRIEDLILTRRYARGAKKNFDSLLKNKESIILQDIGYYYFNNDRFYRSKKCFYGSWRLHKTRIKSLAYYFLSILPKPVVLFLRKIKRKVSKT